MDIEFFFFTFWELIFAFSCAVGSSSAAPSGLHFLKRVRVSATSGERRSVADFELSTAQHRFEASLQRRLVYRKIIFGKSEIPFRFQDFEDFSFLG